MKVKVKPICVLTVLLACPGLVLAGNIISDSFETGDMSSPDNKNFSWGGNNRTSIVTMDPDPVAVWNNGPIYNSVDDSRDWTAYDGDYSLRFRYGANENWSEQRFAIGSEHPELWASYWMRVPVNFEHQTADHTNNKLLALWMDGYEGYGDGPTVVWQFRRSGSDGSSISRLYHWSPDTGSSGRHSGEKSGNGSFINVPEDQGRWMHLVFRVVASSSTTANDGVIQTWRRWADEDEYDMLHDQDDARLGFPNSNVSGFSAGYLMGWANAPYAENTEFLIDDFKLSNESLLSTEPRISRPSPPENVSYDQ